MPDVLDSFFVGDLDEAAALVVRRSLENEGGYACLANAHVVVTADRDQSVRQALDEAWAVFPDGSPVAWLQRRLGSSHARRIAGPDLMPAVIGLGEHRGVRHFLFGSTDGVLDRLEAELRRRFPDAEIVGSIAPPFGVSGPDESNVFDRIRAARPHLVWCALGAPKQERWMQANASRLSPAVIVGVGAAFDFLSHTKPRAPRWLQALGLEWLHRFASEPVRLGPRYLRTNGAFMVLCFRTLRAR